MCPSIQKPRLQNNPMMESHIGVSENRVFSQSYMAILIQNMIASMISHQFSGHPWCNMGNPISDVRRTGQCRNHLELPSLGRGWHCIWSRMRSHCGTCLVQNDQNAGAHGFAPVLFAAAWCWKYQVAHFHSLVFKFQVNGLSAKRLPTTCGGQIRCIWNTKKDVPARTIQLIAWSNCVDLQGITTPVPDGCGNMILRQ